MTEGPSWQDFVGAWELFREPILCAAIAGVVLGFLSVYVVLRQMVFVSAALSQVAGLGVALAFYAEIHLGLALDPLYGAAALALLATAILSIDAERVGLTREGVLGLLFASSGAAAVLVGDRIAQEAHDIQAILFGTAVLVRREDLMAVAIAGAVISVVQLWWFHGLSFASFDPTTARVQGLPVRLLNIVLLASVALMVGVSARALGSLPVLALSTLPAMAPLLLGLRVRVAFAAAALLGGVAGALGYVGAFFYETPVGATQAATAAAAVLAAAIVRGLLRFTPAARAG